MVGHLGRTPLAALAVGAGVLGLAGWFGVVIAFGTTGRAARHYGAGARADAVAEGVQASWLALGLGAAMLLTIELLAAPIAGTLAGSPEVAQAAAGWLRIAALGIPGLLLATAGNGWLRGVQDTRRPMRYLLGANLLSAVLAPLLVYPVGLGLTGSAIANVTALQLWIFSALLLDAVAVAAQSLVGAALGAADDAGARQLAARIGRIGLVSGLAFALALLAGTATLPRLFSTDPQVYAQVQLAWPWFVGMQPLAGVVFALDGVLIGAGDVRYLRDLTILAALGGFLPMVWLAYALHLGLGGVWAGLTLLIVVRLVGMLGRMRSGRWAVVGVSLR